MIQTVRWLFLLASTALAAELKIDHVTACGVDLKKMQEALASAGINAEYGGPHANRATEMALASFADGSYLELIAMQPKADPQAASAHEWSRQIRGNAGPCAWAARTDDASVEAARLRTAGIKVNNPERSGRARPDGFRLDWETALVGSTTRGVFFPFLIRDFTPRAQRVFPNGKPSNAQFAGVSKVVIGVEDLPRAIAQFRAAYGWAAPMEVTDEMWGARMAHFAGTPLVLAVPTGRDPWLSRRIKDFGEGPVAIVVKGSKLDGSTTRWLNQPVRWLTDKAGWRLGVE